MNVTVFKVVDGVVTSFPNTEVTDANVKALVFTSQGDAELIAKALLQEQVNAGNATAQAAAKKLALFDVPPNPVANPTTTVEPTPVVDPAPNA